MERGAEASGIVVPVKVDGIAESGQSIRCDALVDTGTSHMILPLVWRDRLGDVGVIETIELETAAYGAVKGVVCGPVRIQIEGFRPVYGEVVFADSEAYDQTCGPVIGHIVLAQCRAAVDLHGRRLVRVESADLKPSDPLTKMEAPATCLAAVPRREIPDSPRRVSSVDVQRSSAPSRQCQWLRRHRWTIIVHCLLSLGLSLLTAWLGVGGRAPGLALLLGGPGLLFAGALVPDAGGGASSETMAFIGGTIALTMYFLVFLSPTVMFRKTRSPLRWGWLSLQCMFLIVHVYGFFILLAILGNMG